MLAGVPSFFVRTAGCNLRCAWCDTPYASWRPEGRRTPVDEVVAQARASGCRHVVVTGGEPLLQREIGTLTAALSGAGHHVTIETAGTLAPELTCHLLSVSPKAANSDPAGAWRERHRRIRAERGPLAALLARHPEHQVKFVVRGRGDLPEILALVGQLAIDRGRVLLMPEGATREEIGARGAEVARMCLDAGFRYSPRLHVDLFGGGRGV
ncbi:MAG: 7-carboxy-7-deazaguanine synthase QueE [Acidobacteria bacterium]|nr:7-carboxy-7-deazaguanine synthase QueE [Acidobacteriota bacterium]